MKIYTRRGDEGETSLLGGVRVRKTDPRVDAYGTVDELNAALGLALALASEAGPGAVGADAEGAEVLDVGSLGAVQEDLFTIGSRLAAAEPERAESRGTIPRLPPERVEELESWIDRLDEELTPLDAFILPGGGPAGAQLHCARTICRRAERGAVALAGEDPELRERIIPYLNRLSDLLFTLARAVNHRTGNPEAEWVPRRRRQEEDR